MTRRQRIDILQDRHDYLLKKRDERVDEGRPINFITDEIKVLAWAIDTLTEMVEDDLQNVPNGDAVARVNAAEKSTTEVL